MMENRLTEPDEVHESYHSLPCGIVSHIGSPLECTRCEYGSTTCGGGTEPSQVKACTSQVDEWQLAVNRNAEITIVRG